uniref:Bromodomain-containing protein n=1 Tax=Caenorhabditis tropicalis TaxID=1561998 RepID=A0A1I7THQ3_9PELO
MISMSRCRKAVRIQHKHNRDHGPALDRYFILLLIFINNQTFQQPVKGIVQPRVLPPFGKPTRHTNKLDYIMTTVLKEAAKHKHVWPFQKPVDAQTLMIPLYHERITRPMDLKTIESRLKSTYYTCAQECIDDIETVFQNCYTFNGKEDDVTIMAQNVHEVIKKSLEQAPREEHDMDVYWGKNKKKTAKEPIKTVLKKESRGPSEAPSDSATEPMGKPERKVAGKKTGKRKVDSDEDEKPEQLRAKREVTVTKKEVHQPISAIMKPAHKLLTEFFSKKYAEFAWVFYDPVDAEGLGLHDYRKIIKEPMDLKTIRSKMDTGVYKEPSEFEHDIRLMLKNCFLYNPVGDPVYIFGTKFQEVFDKRWADIEDAHSRASSVAPQSAPVSLPTTTPKLPKSSTIKKEKEPKLEPIYETGGSKSEDVSQINNALNMIREREDKLRAELAATAAMKEKLLTLKTRRENNPNEPFPDRLITETRIMCTNPIGQSAPGASAAAKNGRAKKTNSAKLYGYEFDSDDEENKPALTYEEKRNLSQVVNRLPPQQLSTIISIIQRRECSALTHQTLDESEIELDFESLGDMCLREMAAFMKTIQLNPDEKEEEDGKPLRPAAPSKSATGTAKPEKKKKNFNMSESSDDETSNNRKRRKKESSDESESSSSSDEDSDDEGPTRSGVPRKSGQPPSTSREWNQPGPPPRMGGMGGQPPMSRVQPSISNMGKNAPGASNSYQAPKATTSSTASSSVTPAKPPVKIGTLAASTSSKNNEKATKKGQSILDTLLPDTFGASSSSSQAVPPPNPSVNMTSPKENGGAQIENGENEEARIHRLRMEAKRARQREDENSVSMSNQMEIMSAFEFDNTY